MAGEKKKKNPKQYCTSNRVSQQIAILVAGYQPARVVFLFPFEVDHVDQLDLRTATVMFALGTHDCDVLIGGLEGMLTIVRIEYAAKE